MNAKEKARSLNSPGLNHHNCCQAVLGAMCENVGLDPETAANIGTCFGGGAMCGGMCGAASGALMYIGLKYGNSPETKNRGKAFLDEFKARHQYLNCSELLNTPEGRKQCPTFIESSIDILEKL